MFSRVMDIIYIKLKITISFSDVLIDILLRFLLKGLHDKNGLYEV